ncbi:hypothetical protein [Hazenella coriacea]|uniref:Uncharacterized protein n=1 Tax=Hazenella coriacea TaxID=1179467 RepID=A0A4R3L3S3_9BACL|nr:hypothetical protein [Hazenella coriacea]TCS94189.1 hypothetical protein EDD58_10455 [Hazenella coriacea]
MENKIPLIIFFNTISLVFLVLCADIFFSMGILDSIFGVSATEIFGKHDFSLGIVFGVGFVVFEFLSIRTVLSMGAEQKKRNRKKRSN